MPLVDPRPEVNHGRPRRATSAPQGAQSVGLTGITGLLTRFSGLVITGSGMYALRLPCFIPFVRFGTAPPVCAVRLEVRNVRPRQTLSHGSTSNGVDE